MKGNTNYCFDNEIFFAFMNSDMNKNKINLITLDSCFKTKSTNFSVLDSNSKPRKLDGHYSFCFMELTQQVL